jgi:F0F1-type ATP synthase delta subunit
MMNAKQEDALAKQLSKATGKTVKLTFKENADIIGGLILHMDGKMLDHSIKGKLQRLELALR